MNIATLKKRKVTVKDIASALGVTTQAIYAWRSGTIPELRLYQLRKKRPQWFR